MTASLLEIQDALAAQLETVLGPLIQNLQVSGRWIVSPTPPTLDVMPSNPFQEIISFGAYTEIYLDVRARVHTADNVGGQDALLEMMDTNAATSVMRAIISDKTLGGVVGSCSIDTGPAGLQEMRDSGGQGSWLGTIWRVRVMP